MQITQVILTALLSVIALFSVTKIMGHKQVAQLDFFDYVSGITIGSIGAELATELEEPYKPLIALGVYGLVSLFLNFVSQKIPRTRRVVNGTPTILMKDGRIYRENLKKAKLDLSEFMLLSREMGYFDLSDIALAVFEYNGRLSILPRAARRPLTPEDMKIEVEPAHIATELSMDGRIMSDNLTRMGLDGTWLDKRIRSEGYRSPADILLALYRSDADEMIFYPKE